MDHQKAAIFGAGLNELEGLVELPRVETGCPANLTSVRQRSPASLAIRRWEVIAAIQSAEFAAENSEELRDRHCQPGQAPLRKSPPKWAVAGHGATHPVPGALF